MSETEPRTIEHLFDAFLGAPKPDQPDREALIDNPLTPFGGGLTGKLIRTVSRADVAPVDGDGRGGSVIRTVSFLGSCGSAIQRPGGHSQA